MLAIVAGQLEKVAAHGLTDDELARGKGQMRGALVLGLEDAESRMSRLGKSELSYGAVLEVDELLAQRRRGRRPTTVRAIAADLLDSAARAYAAVGPFDDHGFDRYVGGAGNGEEDSERQMSRAE